MKKQDQKKIYKIKVNNIYMMLFYFINTISMIKFIYYIILNTRSIYKTSLLIDSILMFTISVLLINTEKKDVLIKKEKKTITAIKL